MAKPHIKLAESMMCRPGIVPRLESIYGSKRLCAAVVILKRAVRDKDEVVFCQPEGTAKLESAKVPVKGDSVAKIMGNSK